MVFIVKELFTAELIEKAKEAKSAAELITLAKENGTEITAEEAANYFAKLNQKTGEELENVAGGGCYNSDGRLIVTGVYNCEHWSCIRCGHSFYEHRIGRSLQGSSSQYNCPTGDNCAPNIGCAACGHCSAAGGYIVCNHPENHD